MQKLSVTKTRLLFGLAVAVAAGMPFVLSKHLSNSYAAPVATELSAEDTHYVAQRVAEYCQAKSVPTMEPTMAKDPNAPSVPVVLYHRITTKDEPSHEVTRPDLFRQHMQWLKDEGYTTMTVEELSDYMDGKKATLPPKPVVITFDDGWQDNVEAAKTLKEFGFGATFYVISGFFNNKMYFSEDELRTLSQNPKFEIGSHTHSHFVNWETKINTLDLCTMASEMVASKKILERIIKKPVTSIAWPYGYNTKEAVYVASQVGYRSTMMVNRDTINQPGRSPLFTRRLNVDGTCGLSEFKEMVTTQKLKECS